MTLVFPVDAEDLALAFDNAISSGAMQRNDPARTDYWARHEYVAHDVEDGVDVFFNALAGLYVRVSRTEVST